MKLWEICSLFRPEVLSNFNNIQKSCIYSIYLVVIPSQFVLHIVSTENLDSLGHHNPKELLSWSHWAQLIVPSPYQVALIFREGIHILHTFPRLLRKDWATQDWVLSSLRDQILIWTPCYHASNWSWLPARVQFLWFPGSILLVVMIHLLLEECIHDKPLHKIVSSVLNHEILSNFNNTQKSCAHFDFCENIHSFQFVLHIVAIEDSGVMGCHSPKNFCLDFTEDNWLSHQYPDQSWRDSCSHISSTAPLRLSWFAETIMRKTASIVSWVATKWIETVFHVLCFWIDLWTMGS